MKKVWRQIAEVGKLAASHVSKTARHVAPGIEKLRYMHRNPVKRGLVESPDLWQWSSFRAYALGETGPVKINDWEVLKMKIRPPAA